MAQIEKESIFVVHVNNSHKYVVQDWSEHSDCCQIVYEDYDKSMPKDPPLCIGDVEVTRAVAHAMLKWCEEKVKNLK